MRSTSSCARPRTTCSPRLLWNGVILARARQVPPRGPAASTRQVRAPPRAAATAAPAPAVPPPATTTSKSAALIAKLFEVDQLRVHLAQQCRLDPLARLRLRLDSLQSKEESRHFVEVADE